MPFCPNCGTEVSEDTQFCPECGRPLPTEQEAKGTSRKKITGIVVGCIIAVIVIIALFSIKPWERTPSIPGVLFSDDFSDESSGWEQESLEDHEFSYEDGEYHILVKKANWASWELTMITGSLTDFALEIDARLVSGPSGSTYGVIFRYQNSNNFYSYLVGENGYYCLWKFVNAEWVILRRPLSSDFVNKGNTTNHLKVVCRGTQIELYANGYHLATVTDDSFAYGYVGMIVDIIEPDAHAAFDNIKVYSLD